MPHARNIRYSDRGTLTNLLLQFNGYTISTGVLSTEMYKGIVSIPLAEKHKMTIGYIMHKKRKMNELLEGYIDELHNVIAKNNQVNGL